MTEDLRLAPAVDAPVPTEEPNNGDKKLSITCEKKTRKRGPFGIFKAALFMMHRFRSDRKKKPVLQLSQSEEVPSKGENWRKLVGSIRPLHVPDNQSPTLSPSTTVENFDDLLQPASSCSFPSPSVYGGSSVGTMSQYASASNLQELDDNNSGDDEDDPDEVFDALRGDELIDAKAEEFIAQFYRQMELQHI